MGTAQGIGAVAGQQGAGVVGHGRYRGGSGEGMVPQLLPGPRVAAVAVDPRHAWIPAWRSRAWARLYSWLVQLKPCVAPSPEIMPTPREGCMPCSAHDRRWTSWVSGGCRSKS